MDLLQGKREVQVKHTAQLGFYAHGARKVVCHDFPKAANILRKALSQRCVSAVPWAAPCIVAAAVYSANCIT